MDLIDLAEIARLEEARQAAGTADVAAESRPVAGGTMSRGEPGTWVNTAIGLGLAKGGEAVRGEEIDGLIAWYESARIEPRVDVCPYAHPSLVAGLGARGFRLRHFETIFWRELRAGERVRPAVEPPAGLEIREVDPRGGAQVREFAATTVTGFCPPGVVPREADIELAAKCARHSRSVGVTAHLDGVCVGAGAVEVFGLVAGLYALSVLPAHRRQGVQQTLIAHRLEVAVRRGARLATIGSLPGVATERNVRRMGFGVGYTKVTMVRPGARLAAGVW